MPTVPNDWTIFDKKFVFPFVLQLFITQMELLLILLLLLLLLYIFQML